jgi:hypothetical protein
LSKLQQFKFFLWSFGRFKVPMIGYTRPKLLVMNDQTIIVKIPLKRRTKNHLNSMYFGALAVGADIAGGFHGFYHADRANTKASIVFKSFRADFLSRPESDVYFVSEMGDTVKAMIAQSKLEKKRINKPIDIKAFTNYNHPDKKVEVAHFILELSIKALD